jgi:metal-sulfur cluster biosynthetic enzyme
MAPPIPSAVWDQLRKVFDPEIPVNIVDLGLVYSMDVEKITDAGPGHKVDVAMTLTAPGCGMGPAIAEDAKGKILLVPGVADADVRITWEPGLEPVHDQRRRKDEARAHLGSRSP